MSKIIEPPKEEQAKFYKEVEITEAIKTLKKSGYVILKSKFLGLLAVQHYQIEQLYSSLENLRHNYEETIELLEIKQ